MAKRQMISDEEAQQMLAGSGKPKAKGKKRRSEIEHDAELEGKLTKRVSEHKREKQEPEHDSKVHADALRGMMSETIARVYEEMWPGMTVRTNEDEPNAEMAEEAYILSLTMILGNSEDTPRHGLKIREVEISNDIHFCKAHAS
jgi:hypothetical protein